jgi:hypothetical protein
MKVERCLRILATPHSLRQGRMVLLCLKYFEMTTDISLSIPDMITATPRQLLCQTTDVVTGWVNGFHFWDGAGNVLTSQHVLQSNSNVTVHVGNITYPWRHTKDLPTAYSNMEGCTSGDSPWAANDKLMAGMMAKSIKKGVPEDYREALRRVGSILPPTVVDSDHSILQAQPFWIDYFKLNDVNQIPSSSLLISCTRLN